MATFFQEHIADIPIRSSEVHVLLDAATAQQGSASQDLHDALCRAAIVLMVSHLEGFVRDCARALVRDINSFSSFVSSSTHVKWTFCRALIDGDDKKDHVKIKRLISLLDGLDTKLTPEPFLLGGKNDDNRNPTPAVLERVAKQFGIERLFARLAASRADEVFTNSTDETGKLALEMKEHLLEETQSFPYTVDPIRFGLVPASGNLGSGRTLWELFLDDVLKKRHDIAHGSNRLNVCSTMEISEFQEKMNVLEYSYAIVLCDQVRSPTLVP